MLNLWIEDTDEQREAIKKAVFAIFSPKSPSDRDERERIKQICIVLWFIIAEHAGDVVIPFWDEISAPNRTEPRLNRQFCSMIPSFELFDAENREREAETGAIIAT